MTLNPLVVLASFVVAAVCLCGCSATGNRSAAPSAAPPAVPGSWSIALHGGAGTIDKDSPRELVAAYETALATALDEGTRRLAEGQSALDVAEAVVRMLEDNELFNAGRGAALTAKGTVELDASIMDGATLKCGAVAGVRTVKNPVSLARLVMLKTPHVLLAGDGAEEFATLQSVTRVPNDSFITPRRRKMLDDHLKEQAGKPAASAPSSIPVDALAPSNPQHRFGTVGCVVRDSKGNLAAATSTGGMTGKRFGRIGDSPLIGAGNYASNTTCAVSCTGTGEQFIRHGVARMVAARMELAGENLDQAARHLVFKTLSPDDGGLIAVCRDGSISMPYNSEGMFRAAATSGGLRLVKIWE
jgi:beta-aspartyl-peptidase (threonine type)